MSKKRGLPQAVEMRHDAHYVDTLTKRFEHHVGKYVPIIDVEANPKQPRTNLGDLSDLKASILSKGVLEPLLVRRSQRSEHGYQIISGERRYHAALEAGLDEVPVVEIDATDSEVLEIALIENLQRKDLTAFEEADGYAQLMEVHQLTQEQIAESIGKSRSSVAETLRLRRIPAAIRELCRQHEIEAKSMLTEISRLESDADMERMVEAIANGELDRAALRERKKASRGDDSSSQRAKPFVFKFAQKDLPYRFQLSFKRSDVPRDEVISAIEEVLKRLKAGLDTDAVGDADLNQQEQVPGGTGEESEAGA